MFGLVVRHGVTVVAVGLALGAGASYAFGGLIESLMFGITPEDTVARLMVALLIAAVGTAACLIPARRAARVDPIVALRNE